MGLNKTFTNQSILPGTEDRMAVLQSQYELRLKALHGQIARIYDAVSQDEILAAMKENETSNVYVGQRIKEIVDENIAAERETQIQQLMQDLAFSKSETTRLGKIIQASENEKDDMRKELEDILRQKEEAEKRGRYFEDQVNRLQNDLGSVNSQFEKIVRSTQDEAREMSAQHQENYSVAKRETLLLGQKLEDSLKELEDSRRETEEAYKSIERMKRE